MRLYLMLALMCRVKQLVYSHVMIAFSPPIKRRSIINQDFWSPIKVRGWVVWCPVDFWFCSGNGGRGWVDPIKKEKMCLTIPLLTLATIYFWEKLLHNIIIFMAFGETYRPIASLACIIIIIILYHICENIPHCSNVSNCSFLVMRCILQNVPICRFATQ
jgi:hypothetical protein